MKADNKQHKHFRYQWNALEELACLENPNTFVELEMKSDKLAEVW